MSSLSIPTNAESKKSVISGVAKINLKSHLKMDRKSFMDFKITGVKGVKNQSFNSK